MKISVMSRLIMAVGVVWVFAGARATSVQFGARRANVGIGIRMTELADPNYLNAGPSWGRVASFAPDGKEFVIVLRQGDLKRDVNHYTVLLWRTDRLGSEIPQTILRMDSSSIRPAIDPSTISWAPDSGSFTFLGEHEGGPHEVYQFIIKTRTLRALTYSSTSVISYSRNRDGTAIAYEALPPFESLWGMKTLRSGLVVTKQFLPDLITGRNGYEFRGRSAERRLFVQNQYGTRMIPPMPGTAFVGDGAERSTDKLSISPNGRYVIVAERVPIGEIPATWYDYHDWFVQLNLSMLGRASKTNSYLSRYIVIDAMTGRSRVLLNSPVVFAEQAVWAPNSKAVIISDTLLPIVGASSGMELSRITRRMTVEINIANGAVKPVGRRCFQALEWRGNELTCEAQPNAMERLDDQLTNHVSLSTVSRRQRTLGSPMYIRYRRSDGRWRATGAPSAGDGSVEVFLKEGLNFPPKIFYRLAGRKVSGLLWNLNPQFKHLKLAREKRVTWTWSKGRQFTGGLYYPPDYQPARRYPLVIQTHGFDPHRFEYFGPYSTAFAAQPLASRDIFVLQVDDAIGFPERFTDHAQLQDVETAIKIYKSAIVYLGQLGMVDTRRVGVIGWSHTCFYVKWALAHEPGMFAAATVAEGEDGGYLQYITEENKYVDIPTLYGGGPFGRYLESWIKLSPSFGLDRVRTPLWINVLNPRFVLGDWEWFDGLRDLGKPVEMVMLDGRAQEEHMLQKPLDRLISYGDNVDWFDFWLNGHEDPNPAKADQYRRWEKLCDAQIAENPAVPTFCVPTRRFRASPPEAENRRHHNPSSGHHAR